MAKGSAPASPAPAPVAKPLGPSAIAKLQSVASERAEDIVNWGNGEPADAAPPAMAREGNLADEPAAPAKVTPQKGEPDHPDELAPKGADDDAIAKPADEPKETAAEKRQRALDALGAERRARALEQELKSEREKREGAEKMTLGELLKARGVNKDDLLEKLLTGADDLGLPPKLEGQDALNAELKRRLDEAEAKLKDRDAREEQRQIADGVRIVEQALKDTEVPLPLIDSLGKYEDVMNEAYKAYVAAGKEGTALDYLPKAAEKVETRLRKENPRLAALADAAAKAGKGSSAAAEAVGAPARANGITRRVAARPDKQPTPLPLDPQERDAAIRKEFGWG